MSIKLINLILDNYSKDITSSERLVAVVMARRADNKTMGNIFPSYTRIARESGLSRRCVINCVQSLIDKGIISKVSTGSNLTHTNNEYQFNIDKIKQSSREAKVKIKFKKNKNVKPC